MSVANPTKADLAGELAKRVEELEKAHETHREVTEWRLKTLEQVQAAQREALDASRQQLTAHEERVKVLEKSGDQSPKLAVLEERSKVLEKHADHPATLASHDQRLSALEKGTDRFWQALPIVLSGLALLTAAYTAFVKK